MRNLKSQRNTLSNDNLTGRVTADHTGRRSGV
jgi:hypothetical protein